MFKKFRRLVLPLNETDKPITRLGKNVGFVAFLILFLCVSFGILLGIGLAL